MLQLPNKNEGFTMIELIMVIVIVGILAAVALPKFVNLSTSARIAALENIAGTMKSTISLIKMHAYAQGLSVVESNPGGSSQTGYLVSFKNSTSEVDWRNLCPESEAELGDKMTMIDFINLRDTEDLTSQVNNQYTLVGYDIPGFSVPTNQGCYVIYDSFGSPDCTITVVTADC